jgi:poly(3-hydroxybutyrate) depolymerase
MTRLVLASALSFGLVIAAHTQAKPDFSGTWQMDPARSDSAAQSEPIGPVTLVITQSTKDVRVDTTTNKGTTTRLYQVVAVDKPQAADVATARWRGETLIFDAVREVRGQSVTMQQVLRLSADSNEVVVESVVNVQHGYTQLNAKTYGAGKDVFVRRGAQ